MRNIPDELLPEKIELYKIILPLRNPVYMAMEKSFDPEKESIVIIDAFRFIPLWWKAKDCQILPQMKRKDILAKLSTDDKYKRNKALLDKCFANGPTDPVIFPYLARFFDGEFQIRDGNTRIVWLMLNGALAFPMTCPNTYKDSLCNLAGIE